MWLPDFKYEKILWENGFACAAGMDEVGRGAIAGPVVAATVVFGADITSKKPAAKIDDSKRLKCEEREKAAVWILKNSVLWGIGVSGVSEINKFGIVKATNKAFRRSLISAQTNHKISIDYLLIDGFCVPNIRHFPVHKLKSKFKNFSGKYVKGHHRQLAIIKGDQKSFSIAAASIIAKVWRDDYMTKIANLNNYQVYGWDKNKGYGTSDHRESVRKFGISRLHRSLFVRNIR
jgi:ribonuclease HII